ncbi:MAG TPA: UvrD-helicase domain-containing protein [Oligoflexus sp.]|uniref:UvrD-helicase domain-containing protein n=1 Tax=Oligoflexus sp. TaxID=1971216 RepID=UPI002D7F2FA6|nr:UvrD-helicase domain-containing protein [Oligoflexus sp.]HET9237191.1 UvrD-helicase domain-containing protein [Oligoflexus sp.]
MGPSNLQDNPQNPYRSFVVRASAGSGKTWQLSRRFLQLVAAGAHPGSILTVTFTRKAAAEMRERILDSAAQLLMDDALRESFEKDLFAFHKDMDRAEPGRKLPPPRGAEAAARLILANTQSLRIATIDSIFLEWIRKFPFEASAGGSLRIPTGFDLLSQRGEERLLSKAWSSLMKEAQKQGLLQEWGAHLCEDFHLLDVHNRIKELSRHESFLWLVEKQANSVYLQHPLPEVLQSNFLATVQGALQEIAWQLPPDRMSQALAAIASHDLTQLQELRILKGDGTVHGGTFRGKKKEMLAHAIETVDRAALEFLAEQKKNLLNARGSLLFQIYQLFDAERRRGKEQTRSLAFTDLIKGGYHLFSEAEAAGIRFLLHRSIHHLLLDEFQDTSILQWTVFRAMATEMLAGKGLEAKDHLPPSVFIVGDAKQSIYGFREAEALILDEAAHHLSQRSAGAINLSVSYRTSPLLLDLVNRVFCDRMRDFPEHRTAVDPKSGNVVVPGPASVTVVPLFTKSESCEEPVQAEAQFLAEQLAEWIHGPRPKMIFDKKLKGLRSLEARDCAVLYRASTQARVYAEALRSAGFAVRMEEGQSFFERLEIRDLVALCRYMANPSDTLSLIELLKSPLLAIPDTLLLEGLHRIPSHKDESRVERHQMLLEWLMERGQTMAGRLLEAQARRQIQRPALFLQDWMQAIEFPQRYAAAFGEEEGALAQANGARFAELLFEMESAGIYDWYPLLDRLDQLAAEKAIGLAEVSSDAVQLMTIHKSKGLEFPLVMLVGTGEEWDRTDPYWAKVKDHSCGTGVFYVGRKTDQPTDDTHMDGIHHQLLQESTAENLRLLYVALTRAQYCLVVSGHQRRAQKPDDHSFHSLIHRAAEALGAAVKSRCHHEVLELMYEGCLSPDTPLVRAEERGIQNFWTLPAQRGRGRDEIRTLAPARLLQESGKHSHREAHPFATSFGSFVHMGLEAELKRLHFDAEDIWMSLRGAHPFTEYKAALGMAQSKLEKILQSSLWKALIADSVQTCAEMPVAFVKDRQLVRGVIDLLLTKPDGSLLIVDYKTIADIRPGQNFEPLIAEKKYDQQLALYAEAVRRLNPGKVVRAALLFTELPELVAMDNHI